MQAVEVDKPRHKLALKPWEAAKQPDMHINGLYKISADRCIKDLEGLSDPGLPELFAAGTAYRAALANVVPVNQKAHTYYQEKD